ncbi:MAG: serine hydrolase domain-containing protein [Planctomycetota bacterium]
MKQVVRHRVTFAAVVMVVTQVATAQDRSTQVLDFLQQLQIDSGTPGVSAAVAFEGEIVFSAGVGHADMNNMVPASGRTVHNIGSISKVNAAVGVMKLVESGAIDLDAPIQTYVPSFPKKQAPITLRHIMTHTSGIRHYAERDFEGAWENTKRYETTEELITIFKDDPLLFDPGQHYSYSSYASNLLQGAIEAASGMRFELYMKRQIWEPAGMLASSFDVPERIVRNRARGYRRNEQGQIVHAPYGDLSYKFAGGGMLSTAEDLVRLCVALNRGMVLGPSTVQEMYRQQVDVRRFREGELDDLPFRQGLVWRTVTDEEGRLVARHGGSVAGFRSFLVNYPEHDVAVAVIGNARHFQPQAATFAIARVYLNGAVGP